MEYCGVNFSEDLALICESHTFDTFDLAKRKGDHFIEIFRRNKMIYNEEVNIQYLAICLRLADLMDFDRERTPNILFKYLSPKNKISLNEWMKHLSIIGWRINKNEIRYEAECTHPVYQNVLYQFIDQIDAELERCDIIIKDNKEEVTKKYKLDLPVKVNRSYILSKGFYYGPFKFSLDYDKIMKLLMGEQLYGNKDVVIRELLQNSIDACRYRQAFEKLNNIEGYRPQISFVHGIKDEHDILEVNDNGIGMNEYIIQNFFMKIGVSYYSSKYFTKERLEYKKKGLDFNPISCFGIGILSCFMLADKVVVETYRANKFIEKNNALEIEMEGPSQFFVIRQGKRNTYGTKITLFLKKDQKFDLNEILKKYAKHVEFPIMVKTKQILKPIELKDQGFKITTNLLEFENKITTMEIDLSKNGIFDGINGKINIYFLKDDFGDICFETNDIQIIGDIFVKRWNNETLSNLFIEFNPFFEKEVLLRYFSDNKIKINEMSFRDVVNLFERYHDSSSRSTYIHSYLFEKFLDDHYNYTMKIGSFKSKNFSCDGIFVKLPWNNLEIHLPYEFDINIIGEDKPNLRVARDSVSEDETYIVLKNKIKTIIADEIYKQFLIDKISNTSEKRYEFFTGLCQDFQIFKELLKKENIRRNAPILKVQKKEKIIFSSIFDIINDFSGIVYLAESSQGIELIDSWENKMWINESNNLLIDLIANSSKLVFFTDITLNKSYFELSLKNLDSIQYDKKPFNFAKYSGKYYKTLFCKNRFNALNSDHAICKMYFRLKGRSEILTKEIIFIFEGMFKKIIDLWGIDDKNFIEIDINLKQIKLKIIDCVESKYFDEISIDKDDFHFW